MSDRCPSPGTRGDSAIWPEQNSTENEKQIGVGRCVHRPAVDASVRLVANAVVADRLCASKPAVAVSDAVFYTTQSPELVSSQQLVSLATTTTEEEQPFFQFG
jgi:hypothetical protein